MIPLFVTAVLASYSCEASAPREVTFSGDTATAHPIGLPPEMDKRKFSITLSDGDPMQAVLEWPGDPMNVSGTFPALSVGGGAYSFSAFSGGPCLFTETSCLSQVTLVDSGEATAKVAIVPSAIKFTDEARKERAPFFALVDGVCTRSGVKR